MTDAADLRLERVRQIVRLPDVTPVRLPSDSNDAWRIGDVVLRVCWRGDRDRFAREAAVTAMLPPEVCGPRLLDAGRVGDLAWQITRAVAGQPLNRAWHTLTMSRRRDAVRQLGSCLAALHAHPLGDVRALLAGPRPGPDPTLSDVIGADMNPLPYHRLTRLLGPARALPNGDPDLIDTLSRQLDALARHDPYRVAEAGGYGCVHGDAHLQNVLWDAGSVVLLDFEWVRLGPPDLELEPLVRVEPNATPSTPDLRAVLGWLSETHPAAFAAPDLLYRLWLYQLAFTLRWMITDPTRPAAALGALRRIVDTPDHLRAVLPG